MLATWYVFNSPTGISTQTHAAIQSQLAILIEETIKSKKPKSSDFQLDHLTTRSINENLISAQFSYKFNDLLPESNEDKTEQVTQSISGNALLARTPAEDGGLQKWVIQSIKTNQESVSFNDGLVISAGGPNDTDSITTTDEVKTETH